MQKVYEGQHEVVALNRSSRVLLIYTNRSLFKFIFHSALQTSEYKNQTQILTSFNELSPSDCLFVSIEAGVGT